MLIIGTDGMDMLSKCQYKPEETEQQRTRIFYAKEGQQDGEKQQDDNAPDISCEALLAGRQDTRDEEDEGNVRKCQSAI